jgi:hypothetical protein
VTSIRPNGDIVSSTSFGGGSLRGVSVNTDGTAIVTLTGNSFDDDTTLVIVHPDGVTTSIVADGVAFTPAQPDSDGTSAYLTTFSGHGTPADPYVARITHVSIASTPSSTL